MRRSLTVNGFAVQADYDDATVRNVFCPLLHRLSDLQRKRGERIIVFLAAPPATGKSTLAVFLEHLSHSENGILPIQALGMDGFHYHQEYILTHTVLRNGAEIPMQQIKGAPDSFDIEKLQNTLELSKQNVVRWPFYDRRLHDVVENAIVADAPILLIEGNWLLLDRPIWRALPHDFSIFIEAEECFLRDRLIARKIRGGSSPEEALLHYERTDGPNTRLCMAEHLPADLTLRMEANGDYRQIVPLG